MEATLVKLMGYEDANPSGFVHGGMVVKLCDEAAGMAAMRHCRLPCVTGGIDRMAFLGRVNVGELLILSARVNAAWRTSLEVGVRVEAENVITGEVRHTATAYLTMVAVDERGVPQPVAPLPPPVDAVETRRRSEAQVRRANRLAEREQFRAGEPAT